MLECIKKVNFSPKNTPKTQPFRVVVVSGSRHPYPGISGCRKSPGSRDFGILGNPDEGPSFSLSNYTKICVIVLQLSAWSLLANLKLSWPVILPGQITQNWSDQLSKISANILFLWYEKNFDKKNLVPWDTPGVPGAWISAGRTVRSILNVV